MNQQIGEIKNVSIVFFKKLQTGDHHVFNQVVKQYEKKIFRIAYSFFHDKDEAMEIMQDTFLKVHNNIATYKIGTNFSSWIYKISSNLCIDRYRKNKRQRENTLEVLNRNEEAMDTNPLQMALIESKREEIKKAMDKLSQRQRAVFSLKYFSYKKLSEISDILKIANGTVKTLHFRALDRIKSEINTGRK